MLISFDEFLIHLADTKLSYHNREGRGEGSSQHVGQVHNIANKAAIQVRGKIP